MTLDLYKDQILKLAGSIPRVGRLSEPDATATAHSRLCGSRITVDIKIDDNVIIDYAHDSKACAIGKASASVVAGVVVGLTTEDVYEGAEIMSLILRDKTPPPPGLWSALEPFLPVADFRSRHHSAFLPFEALQRAIAEANPSQAREADVALSLEQDVRR